MEIEGMHVRSRPQENLRPVPGAWEQEWKLHVRVPPPAGECKYREADTHSHAIRAWLRDRCDIQRADTGSPGCAERYSPDARVVAGDAREIAAAASEATENVVGACREGAAGEVEHTATDREQAARATARDFVEAGG